MLYKLANSVDVCKGTATTATVDKITLPMSFKSLTFEDTDSHDFGTETCVQNALEQYFGPSLKNYQNYFCSGSTL